MSARDGRSANPLPSVLARAVRLALPFALLATIALAQPPAPPSASQPTESAAPSPQPELFAPGVVSLPDRYEFGITITADESEIFFGIDFGQKYEIWRVARTDDGWGEPGPLLKHETYDFNDPMLDPSEQRLYFISTEPRPGASDDAEADPDIWYIERQDDGWSKPIHAGATINSADSDYYSSFTDDGDLYFASNRGAERDGNYDLYVARSALTEPKAPVRLGSGVNTGAYEADPFVAPDGSYIVFAAGRRGNIGRGDLFIAFRGDDGTFEEAKRLGPPINTEGHELCPFVSRDGRTFYYTSREDIYRIDAAALWADR